MNKPTAFQFFILVFTLSIPFWLLGARIDSQFFPGIPISALAVITPSIAAALCTYRSGGRDALAALLKRLVDWRKISPLWIVPILCLIPACLLLAFLIMRCLRMPMPEPHIEWLTVPTLFLVFLLAGCCEELGWSGYAIDQLQKRSHALQAALLLGVVWAAWHFIPLHQAERGWDWIAWWCIGTVALRVLHVWLYNNTAKSVFGAAVFHATYNVSWQLFPNHGSHYDPKVTSILLWIVAAIVVLIYGPRNLTGDREPSTQSVEN